MHNPQMTSYKGCGFGKSVQVLPAEVLTYRGSTQSGSSIGCEVNNPVQVLTLVPVFCK